MFPALPRTAAALAAAALIPGLVVGFTTTSAQAGIIGCDGKAPTRTGTPDGEQIDGTDGPDVILALGGDDIIYGLGGDDVVCGGDGNDTVYGAAGTDRVFGEAGQDTLFGGDGDDFVKGGDGGDTLVGEAGDDVLGGSGGSDFLVGLVGGDLMTGGLGTDAVSYSEAGRGVVVSLRPHGGANDGNSADGPMGSRDEVRSVEAVFGTDSRDTLTGNSKANFLLPQGGRDRVAGRGGNDFLDVADDRADRTNCGRGRDDVRYDKGIDDLKNCENKTSADPAPRQRGGAPAWPSEWVRAAAG